MKTGLHTVVLFVSVTLSIWLVGCRRHGAVEEAGSPRDISLKPCQNGLLDIAFSAASAIPVDPHSKDRSRMQEIVVGACLDLGQPQRALHYTKQIGDWRRGTAYADLAFYCARHSDMKDVPSYLDLAGQAVEQAEDWHKDRIKAKIAQVHTYLGQTEAAAQVVRGVEKAESTTLAQAEAMVCPEGSFDKTMETLGTLVSAGQFDVVKNVLGAYAELFNRFYKQPDRRALIEGRIKATWGSVPIFVRIDLLAELAGFARAHTDPAKALELTDEAKKILNSANLQAESAIALAAKLARLRFQAGDKELARTEVQEALGLFDAKRDAIVNIYRAQVLRSIAEAHAEMGDTTAALSVYKRAIEAGVENPNSRPRAEDLAATCCSIAVHAVEPDPELWGRIRSIRDDLSDPW
ncbi:MAG: tetratricopeptide repeat protein [Sedimentisphaerales bacterium]|nr:tetratricopeptide repeat protein [Sedimentisphaerales bacterium]